MLGGIFTPAVEIVVPGWYLGGTWVVLGGYLGGTCAFPVVPVPPPVKYWYLAAAWFVSWLYFASTCAVSLFPVSHFCSRLRNTSTCLVSSWYLRDT